MKRIATLLTSIACLMGFSGCESEKEIICTVSGPSDVTEQNTSTAITESEANLTGVVKEVLENSLLMESNGAAYSVSLPTENADSYHSPNVGDEIVVYYDGNIAETYPMQILKVYAITLETAGADAAKWGVTLSATNVLETGMTLVCEQTGGAPTGKLQTGSYYIIEVLQQGIWKEVTQLPQEATVTWTSEAWTISKDTTQQWEVDWEWLYGALPAGTYRIGKEIMDFREAGDFDEAIAYALFSIGNNETESDPIAVSALSDVQLAWANHYAGKQLYVTALNADTMYISSVQHLPIHKMETLGELEQFKQNFGGALTMDQGYNEVPSFHQVTAEMDDAFFEEYTLLVIFVPATSGSLRFGVHSIYKDDSSICVHVEQTNNPEVVTMDLAGWFLTVPLAKTTTVGITTFDADLGNLPQ